MKPCPQLFTCNRMFSVFLILLDLSSINKPYKTYKQIHKVLTIAIGKEIKYPKYLTNHPYDSPFDF